MSTRPLFKLRRYPGYLPMLCMAVALEASACFWFTHGFLFQHCLALVLHKALDCMVTATDLHGQFGR